MIHILNAPAPVSIIALQGDRIDFTHDEIDPFDAYKNFDNYWSQIDRQSIDTASLIRRCDTYNAKRAFWDRQEFIQFLSEMRADVSIQSEWSTMKLRFFDLEDVRRYDQKMNTLKPHTFQFTDENPFTLEMRNFLTHSGMPVGAEHLYEIQDSGSKKTVCIRSEHHATLLKVKFALEGATA